MPRLPKPTATATQQGVAGPSGGGTSLVKQGSEAGKKSRKAVGATSQPLNPMELERRIQQTRKQLQDTEKQIYNLETQYFDNANPQGNAIRGYEGLLSATTVNAKKAAFKPEDRIFSASSSAPM